MPLGPNKEVEGKYGRFAALKRRNQGGFKASWNVGGAVTMVEFSLKYSAVQCSAVVQCAELQFELHQCTVSISVAVQLSSLHSTAGQKCSWPASNV